jgi:hypothetical protein
LGGSHMCMHGSIGKEQGAEGVGSGGAEQRVSQQQHARTCNACPCSSDSMPCCHYWANSWCVLS